jgi:hypothetical protein
MIGSVLGKQTQEGLSEIECLAQNVYVALLDHLASFFHLLIHPALSLFRKFILQGLLVVG